MSRATNVSPSFRKRLRRTGFEQVPCSAHGFQMHRIFRVWFDLFAQAADININATRGNEAIGAPDSVKQLVPGEHAIWARSKIIQQTKLKCAEWHCFSGMTHPIRSWVNSQFPYFNNARRI